MCTTRILARSTSGFISQCSECERIHLAYGTTLMQFEWHHFERYAESISQDVQLMIERADFGRKCVQLAHPEHAGFTLVLTKKELLQVHQMVQEAALLLTTYHLLNNES